MASAPQQHPRPPYGAPPKHQNFLPNGSMSGPMPQPVGVAGLPPNKVLEKSGVRVLCIADVRGHLRTLNELAKKANADYILHTGDFGFYDESSLDRIADKTLKHVAQYSPLLPEHIKHQISKAQTQQPIKLLVRGEQNPLSELSLFLSGTYTLDVPVYTVWGACEDVRVLEKFRSGEYKINNLHIIDEARSSFLDVGGVKLRLLGLGGAVVMHKLFDNGEGKTTIAGGQGTMWTTLLQMGELVDTANRVYDPAETRIFITHNSPAREGLLNQLSVTLKADFSISAGLHFRYGSSYNEFSVNPSLDHYRGKLASSKASFNDVWETVKGEVEPCVSQNVAQQQLLKNALEFVGKMPTNANGGNPFGGPSANAAPGAGQIDESAFKNMWNFNLADAAFGWLVLEVENGRIGTEMKAQGFNFSHRGGKPTQGGHQPAQPAQQPQQQPLQQQVPAPANVPSGPAAQTSTPTAISPALPLTPVVPSGPRNNKQSQPQPPQQAPAASGPVENEASPSMRNIEPALPYSKPGTPGPAAVDPEPVAAPEPEEHKPEEPSNDASSPRDTRPPREKQHGLYVTNISSRDAARELIPEELHSAIKSIDEKSSKTTRKSFYLVHMESDEVAQKALDAVHPDFKYGAPRNESKPFVKLMDDYQGPGSGWGNRGGAGREGMGESRWSRGGNTSESDNPSGGYRGRGGRGGGKFRGGERRESGAFEGRGGRGGSGQRGGGGRRGGTPQGQEN